MFFMTNHPENCPAFFSPHPLFRPSPRPSWCASVAQSKSLFVPPVTYRCRSLGLHREWHLPLRQGTPSPPNKWNTWSMSADTDVKPPADASLELRKLKIVEGTTKCTFERNSISETYDMLKIPSSNAMLVTDFRDVILQNLSLINVLTDLDRAVDLMFLAYVGVAGQGLITADIGDRQYALEDLCGDCLRTMRVFGQCCNSTLKAMMRAFESLLEGEEEQAAKTLESCKNYSTTMSNKCKELSDSFKSLRDDTNSDCRNVQIKVQAQTKTLQELEDARATWQATVAEQKTVRDNLQISITQLQADIDAETARQKVESDREYSVAMMGAFSKTFTSGLGMNSGDNSSSEKDSTTKPAATVDVRLKMNEQKRKEQGFRRDSLATIAKLQAKLKNNETEEQIAESSITALQISIYAMDNITVALDNAKFFWDSMTTYCSNLSKDKMFNYLTLGKRKDKDARIKFYKGRLFLPNAIGFSVKWKSLQVVCEDYAKAAELCKLKAERNIGTDVTVANAKTMLKETNAKVAASLDKQKRLLAQHDQALAREKTMLELQQKLFPKEEKPV